MRSHFLLLSFVLSTIGLQQAWAQVSSLVPGTREGKHYATNVRTIFQDDRGNHWFGTDGNGVYKYDGGTLALLTTSDGLCHNQVRSIQQHADGSIWFTTGDRICSYDGPVFSLYNGSNTQWQKQPGDLWFPAGTFKGVYRYDGKHFYNYQFPGATRNPTNNYDEYDVYCTYRDRSGNIWFGTQSKGVCRYDGKTHTWFTAKGLSGAAVRTIFQDKAGNMWFGNNGYGLFKYNGKTLTNFTDEKHLGNPAFIKNFTEKEGTLARIWAIDEDKDGNLWIGTIDAGAWHYNGKTLTNYTTKHGLPSMGVTAIYKDTKGTMWFGTAGELCKFNGKGFEKVVF